MPTDCWYCAGRERYVAYNDSGSDGSGGGGGGGGSDGGGGVGGARLAMLGEEQWAWLEATLRQSHSSPRPSPSPSPNPYPNPSPNPHPKQATLRLPAELRLLVSTVQAE